MEHSAMLRQKHPTPIEGVELWRVTKRNYRSYPRQPYMTHATRGPFRSY